MNGNRTKDQSWVECGNRGRLSMAMATVALSLAVSASTAVGNGFDLGDADNYGVLFQGNGGNHLNINNGPGLNGLAENGKIGIGGTGSLQLSGPLTINGNIDFAGSVIDNGPYSGNISVNGSITGGHGNVQSDLNMLNALSATLGAELGTSVAIATGGSVNANTTGTLDASGNKVFTVTSVNFANGTFIINGDGSHNVVFNISSSANFHGQIILTGGLTSDEVLFNLNGGNNATLSGGPTLDINTNGKDTTGTFLDPNGQVSIVNAVLDGRLFGGDSHDMQVVSGALINAPSSVPDNVSTLALLGLSFVCLAFVGRKFQFRQPIFIEQ